MRLTQARLRKLLRYNPRTGTFTWLVRRNNYCQAGSVAGYIHRGRRVIRIDERLYHASHLAVLWMTGELPPPWPQRKVDHANRNSLDDRWSNLRIATCSQDQANKGATPGRKLPKGAYKRPNGKYRAIIGVKRRLIHLGSFDTAAEAHAAYIKAAKKYYGEFARAS